MNSDSKLLCINCIHKYSLTQSDQSETELHLLSATTSIATLPGQERSKLNPKIRQTTEGQKQRKIDEPKVSRFKFSKKLHVQKTEHNIIFYT
jgi:hypothetical protein